MKVKNVVLTKVLMMIIVVVFAMMPLSVCAAEKKVGPPITLKFSHQWPQDKEDYVIQTGIRFADEVNKRSGGAIKIVFYPAQSLVKAREQFRAMRQGTVDMSIYPYIYASGEIRELNIVLVPWANTHDNFLAFGRSKAWDFLEKKINEAGVKSLCWIQISGGIASKGKLIRRPADIKGSKMRAGGKYCQKTYRAAGAGIVSMASSEIYTAMQRGLLDAVQTSSSSFGAYKLYEVSKYYLSPEDYSNYFTCEPITISMHTWKKLTPEQQQIMIEVGRELESFALEGAKKEDGRIAKKFADHGCKVEKMSAEDYKEWRTLMEGPIKEFRKDVPNGDWLVDETLKLYK